MTPFYVDDWLTVLGGDCGAVLAELDADSVDCVVTSPPYWNLRDYGTATWIGGDADHQHVGSRQLAPPPGSAKQASKRGSTDVYAGDCACGARRVDQQLGLEATPEEYVERIVAVFREVRRVLKPTGVLWLNLGDSYIDRANASQGALHRKRRDKQMPPRVHSRPPGLKDKDLAGVPFRVVLALQADGWWWRQTVIWNKPNPMPESVEDRPTTSHEYLFLLTKASRYYWDQEAVREPVSPATHARLSQDVAGQNGSARANGGTRADRPMKAVARKSLPGRDGRIRSHDQWHAAHAAPVADRNMRSVWTIPTQPYRGAHFAVFPPRLPELCILAGSSERGVCPECGAPWRRVVARTPMIIRPGPGRQALAEAATGATSRTAITGTMLTPATSQTTGWEATCGHTTAEPVPAVVLDPFGGSGTVGMVAQRLRRRATLIDLNPAYLEQQLERAARAWGVGGRRLVDREVAPPEDSIWTLLERVGEEASA